MFVHGRAPVRVNDIGGWTDTWFAGHGAVCNLAVEPNVEVRLHVRQANESGTPVEIDAVDFGDRYGMVPGDTVPGRHPLLEATIDEVGVPDGVAIVASVHSDVPPGASTGTSAAVSVALASALHALHGRPLLPAEVAAVAHRIEVGRLGLQSGVQDQLASAFGGINFIEITEYPAATVHPLSVAARTMAALDRRLTLVFLGRGHVSSEVHDKVIAELADEGPSSPRLQTLRDLAARARDALLAGDLVTYGKVMQASTDAQRELHEDLVNPAAQRVIGMARENGALGWKVNGAGGDGGSLTLLAANERARDQLAAAITAGEPEARTIPIRLSARGARTWKTTDPPPSSRL